MKTNMRDEQLTCKSNEWHGITDDDRYNTLGHFPLKLLKDYKTNAISKTWIHNCYQTINKTLADYKIKATVTSHKIGFYSPIFILRTFQKIIQRILYDNISFYMQ